MWSVGTRTYRGNFIDSVHALEGFAEHAVAKACLRLIFKIQKVVVTEIDEELRTGRMRVGCSCHGDSASVVRQAVGRFVLDGRGSGFLIHGRGEATALNHEPGNYSMEDCIGVMTIIGIALEVGTGVRGFVRVQLEHNAAQIGGDGRFHILGFSSIGDQPEVYQFTNLPQGKAHIPQIGLRSVNFDDVRLAKFCELELSQISYGL